MIHFLRAISEHSSLVILSSSPELSNSECLVYDMLEVIYNSKLTFYQGILHRFFPCDVIQFVTSVCGCDNYLICYTYFISFVGELL